MLDHAKIRIKAGNGGRGQSSFRREKYVPKGGPDGGDGGKGGDVYLEASNDLSTLLDFQFLDHFEAPNGEAGSPSHKKGKDGQDLVIKVPVGSIIKINKLVADLPVIKRSKKPVNEPKVYQQKMFNYKKMEKMRKRIEDGSEEDKNLPIEVMDKIDSALPGEDLENYEETTNISENDIQTVSEDTTDEDFDGINNEEQKTSSEEYKVYNFSNVKRANDNTRQAQNSSYSSISAPPIFDLDEPGKRILLAKGGIYGRGNSRFKSSQNRAPKIAEPGQQGEQVEIEITLKMVANVGLVGLPNAGKSTILANLTAASPKIGDYPFTTIEPNLGVMYVDDKSFVLADIPGLIEGAAYGKGLGHTFLKHVERTTVLLHVVALPDEVTSATSQQVATNLIDTYTLIRSELEQYGAHLPDKKEIIVINKIDKLSDDSKKEYIDAIEAKLKEIGKPYAFISAQEQLGLNGLKKLIVQTLVDNA